MKLFYKTAKSLFFAIPLVAVQFMNAQVFEIASGGMYFPGGVSENGTVSLNKGTTVYLWNSTQGLQEIGGLTNNTLFGGSALISEDGKKITAGVTNATNNMNELSVYNVETQSWTHHGGIGTIGLDGSLSNSWGISKDGSTVVGLGWLDTGKAHGVKWDATNGMIDLGSTVTGKSSRANAINDDKTIITGWQDKADGSRRAVRWVNGVQEYLTDNSGNHIGEPSAMSSDGKTIVGYTRLFPYVWNETTGYQEIVHPSSSGSFEGGSSAVSGDGKIVIGYFRAFPGLPMTGEGFIWTQENGRKNLNQYVTSLGIDTKGITFGLPLAISKDGKKIVGTGVKAGNQTVAFLIDLTSYLTTEAIEIKQLSIYPNPVKNILNINGADRIGSLEIYNMIGQKIKTIQPTDKIEVSTLAKGTYILKIVNNNKTQNIKFIKE